jgi:hypothetical protein
MIEFVSDSCSVYKTQDSDHTGSIWKWGLYIRLHTAGDVLRAHGACKPACTPAYYVLHEMC